MHDNAFMNDDVHGRCISGENWPHIVILKRNSGCNFKIEKQRRRDTNTLLYVTDFVVKGVTATCEYMCAVRQSRKTKTVVITGMYICKYIRVHVYICIYMYVTL